MEVKPVEVYSEVSNYAVVRMPGRNYPGCVVQGDSLWGLWQSAKVIAEGLANHQADSEEVHEAVEELHDLLLGRLLHYQTVIQKAGFKLPYGRPVSEGDFIAPASADEDEDEP